MNCLQRSRDCNAGGNKGFSWCKKNVYGWSIRMRKTEFHISVCYGWDACVLRLIVDHSTMWFYCIVGILFTNQLWINNRNSVSRCSMFHVWKWSLGKPCDPIMIHAPLPPLYDNWMHLKGALHPFLSFSRSHTYIWIRNPIILFFCETVTVDSGFTVV